MLTLRSMSREEVRGLDARAVEELGLPTLALMENAGRGAAEWLRGRVTGSRPRIVILCGPGNNGGDGGVVARHLDGWGWDVRVVWLAAPERLRGDAAVQWHVLERAAVRQESWPDDPLDVVRFDSLLTQADWVVDGLLGTGLTRAVEGPLRGAIEAVNRAGKPVLALDLPSGLDADTGQALGVAVRAAATVTFVAPKRGFGVAGANAYTGEVVVVDIGLPRKLLEAYRT
ncbi:MAG: NAD(P)H-hydrate epimerase [Isosphaeraceae bacterium]|nr:NAD(P)H-hydrate epimerase [Isosphaeraceae bacterium]